MKIRVGTFNLFQFVEPPYSWYTKKEKFTIEQWSEKTTWIKNQITEMNCDIIGFQEVFSKKALKTLLNELGFKYFKTIDSSRTDKKNELVYTTTIVALASKYPIKNLKKVEIDFSALKKHHLNGFFKFAREPIKATIILPNQKELDIFLGNISDTKLEIERLLNARNKSKEQLLVIKEKTEKKLGEEKAKIIDGHITLFEDD